MGATNSWKGAVAALVTQIIYTPPPTIRDFIAGPPPGRAVLRLHRRAVRIEQDHRAVLQAHPHGQAAGARAGRHRRSRAVVVRNTGNQLNDTTLSSWFYWFKPGQAGTWEATKKNFTLRFGDVECEVMFRPLDTPQDIARVLSLEVTFAIIDEFVEIPRAIIDALSARVGRYPSAVDGGATNWGMWGASNPSTEDNWWYDYLHNEKIVVQPGANDNDDGATSATSCSRPGCSTTAPAIRMQRTYIICPVKQTIMSIRLRANRKRGSTSSSAPAGDSALPANRLCPRSAAGCICPRHDFNSTTPCCLSEGTIPG
jgi:hypothetical protein